MQRYRFVELALVALVGTATGCSSEDDLKSSEGGGGSAAGAGGSAAGAGGSSAGGGGSAAGAGGSAAGAGGSAAGAGGSAAGAGGSAAGAGGSAAGAGGSAAGAGGSAAGAGGGAASGVNSWTATNPLVGMTFWVDPNSLPAQELVKQAANPDAVAALEKIASRSNSHWFGSWVATNNVAAQVSAIVSAAQADDSVPILPLYAIPFRDCGSYSAGGFATAAEYLAWIAQVAAGIGTRPAIVILEPDALGVVSCLSDTQLQERLAMMSDAVDTLRSDAPGAVIYVATVSWISVATSAERLQLAGVANARGFAINTADFKTTESQLTYGESLSAALGGAKYVVDTSRNGLGPYTGTLPWCNPPGRALGPEPSTNTGSPNADAFLWIKTIGRSDGTCDRGEPAAGTWWPEYAIGLAQRAAF
jgi:endoglucanase